jgi:hypothetical protein
MLDYLTKALSEGALSTGAMLSVCKSPTSM